MRSDDNRTSRFALCQEMLAAAEVVRTFDPTVGQTVSDEVSTAGRLLVAGEGSSRIFPAGWLVDRAMRDGASVRIASAGARAARGYPLDDWVVFGVSNSGRTAEVVDLMTHLGLRGHRHRYGLTAHQDTPLAGVTDACFVLSCGPERAVAATKSVVEQALVFQALLERMLGPADRATGGLSDPSVRSGIADAMTATLGTPIPTAITTALADARTVYWAGPTDGVAEELTLKTNEIARLPSDFLPGTYAVHGIEEVMTEQDVLIWLDPEPCCFEKFQTTLVEGVGLTIVAVSSEETPFPTVTVPACGAYQPLVNLSAGWNLLVETGLARAIDLDKPKRARKVGYEVASS